MSESIKALLILFLFMFKLLEYFLILNIAIKYNPTKNKKTEDNKLAHLCLSQF